jgi:hypothetical protein
MSKRANINLEFEGASQANLVKRITEWRFSNNCEFYDLHVPRRWRLRSGLMAVIFNDRTSEVFVLRRIPKPVVAKLG